MDFRFIPELNKRDCRGCQSAFARWVAGLLDEVDQKTMTNAISLWINKPEKKYPSFGYHVSKAFKLFFKEHKVDNKLLKIILQKTHVAESPTTFNLKAAITYDTIPPDLRLSFIKYLLDLITKVSNYKTENINLDEWIKALGDTSKAIYIKNYPHKLKGDD